MVKITVIQCTKRKKPMFEWALESLKNQTINDFEYIIVDHFYDERKDAVNKLIQSLNLDFDVRHIKDKPCRWKGNRPALSNARNTGLIIANGEYVVFHDDNCKMPHDWLEKHLCWLEQNYLVAGSFIPYEYGNIMSDRQDTRLATVMKSKVVSGGWFYGINFSFPVCVAEAINGFDELYDGEFGQEDVDFGVRAERKGYNIMFDPTCNLEHYYDDHGLLMNYPTKHNDTVEIDIIPTKVIVEGIEYYSNQLLVQELLVDIHRSSTRGNNFNITDMRRIAKENSINNMNDIMIKHIYPDKIDWRDGKHIENKT